MVNSFAKEFFDSDPVSKESQTPVLVSIFNGLSVKLFNTHKSPSLAYFKSLTKAFSSFFINNEFVSVYIYST